MNLDIRIDSYPNFPGVEKMKTMLLISLVLVTTVTASMAADRTNMTIQTNMRLSIGPKDGRITGDVLTQVKGTKRTWKDPNAATTSATTTSGTNQDTTATNSVTDQGTTSTEVSPVSSTDQSAAPTMTIGTTPMTPNTTSQTDAGTTVSSPSINPPSTCPYANAMGNQ